MRMMGSFSSVFIFILIVVSAVKGPEAAVKIAENGYTNAVSAITKIMNSRL